MMKHEVPQDEQFDNFLSAQLKQSQPYLMDDNFSAKVMAQLPQQKKLSAWQERLIIVLPLVLISLLVLSQFSLVAIVVKLWTMLFVIDLPSMLRAGLIFSAAALCGACYWFAKQAKLI